MLHPHPCYLLARPARNSHTVAIITPLELTRSPINTPDTHLHGRKPTASSASIHPSLIIIFFFFQRNELLAKESNDGRSCGEAGARAAAVQRQHRRAHRGRVYPVPGARRRRGRRRGRAGGACDQLAEGARHDVPQGRVGAGRVHGRRGPARGPGGGRRQRGDRQGARLLALPEPPLPDHLRGHHVPAPRHRRAPAVARDGIPQAHLGNGAAGHGRLPAPVDAGGAPGARRPARQAAVRPVNEQPSNPAGGRVGVSGARARARDSRRRKVAGNEARTYAGARRRRLSVSLFLGAAAGLPAFPVSNRPDRSI